MDAELSEETLFDTIGNSWDFEPETSVERIVCIHHVPVPPMLNLKEPSQLSQGTSSKSAFWTELDMDSISVPSILSLNALELPDHGMVSMCDCSKDRSNHNISILAMPL
ncbi:hypothetical protein AMS68_003400 [Peltaster fructicola]|uniref:Uncharacterized protein n=1 Tax=Peltaster fructicola TaxID=286661 RepID=A0A6H0XT37_9PEZI|nr:hypothetical protein AMS68_003400 [Peltaster fructicola]